MASWLKAPMCGMVALVGVKEVLCCTLVADALHCDLVAQHFRACASQMKLACPAQ